MAPRNRVVRAIRVCLLAGLGVVAGVALGATSAHADIIPPPSLIGTTAGTVLSPTQTATSTVQSPASTTPVTTTVARITTTQQPSATTQPVQTTSQTIAKAVNAVVAPVQPVVTAVVNPVQSGIAPVRAVVTAVVNPVQSGIAPVRAVVTKGVAPLDRGVVAPVKQVVTAVARVKPVVAAVVRLVTPITVAPVKLVATEVVTTRATDLIRADVQSSLAPSAPSSSVVSALGAVRPSGLAGTSAVEAATGAPLIGYSLSASGPGIVCGSLSRAPDALSSASPVSSQSADRTGVVAPFGAPLPGAPGNFSISDGMLSTPGGSSVPLAAVTPGQWQHTVTAERAGAPASWDVPAAVGSRPDVSPG